MKFYVGTSGYMINQKIWWELDFNSLEINSTFYSLPKRQSTWQNWYAKAPKDFLFSLKMSNFLTHKKRLIDSLEPWERFWDGAKNLKDKLGVILFQFPPSFIHNEKKGKDGKTTFERLQFLQTVLPKNVKFAFEFRNTSWNNKTVIDFLKKQNWAFANVLVHNTRGWAGDLPTDQIWPNVSTADFVYFRFHGSTGMFRGEYSKPQLQSVIDFCKAAKVKESFVYFNNYAFAQRSKHCTLNDHKIYCAAVCNGVQFMATEN